MLGASGHPGAKHVVIRRDGKFAGGELPAPDGVPGSDRKELYCGTEGPQACRRIPQEPQARRARPRLGHGQDRRSRHERPEVARGRRQGRGFEGGQTPLARRLPKLPGFTNINRVEYLPVNVKRLEEKFEAGDVVDGESLKAKGIIKHADALVKVLGDGEITKALTVKVDKVSASAKAKIEAAGGKVEEPC